MWDASQVYGYDKVSRQRVKLDPADTANLLLLLFGNRPGERLGYLPSFISCPEIISGGCAADPINPAWSGQEATGFPDNWNIGLSFYHNVFAREHNAFVDEFRNRAAQTPDADSGLRNPDKPDAIIQYKGVSANELFEIARLVVAAETQAVRHLLSASQSASRHKRRELALWQRRFWHHQIRDNVDYARHVDYVHNNPVKHGLAAEVRDWPYSTFHRYVRLGLYLQDWAGAALPRTESGYVWGTGRIIRVRTAHPVTSLSSPLISQALAEAKARGWTVVSMKDDWNPVFVFKAK